MTDLTHEQYALAVEVYDLTPEGILYQAWGQHWTPWDNKYWHRETTPEEKQAAIDSVYREVNALLDKACRWLGDDHDLVKDIVAYLEKEFPVIKENDEVSSTDLMVMSTGLGGQLVYHRTHNDQYILITRKELRDKRVLQFHIGTFGGERTTYNTWLSIPEDLRFLAARWGGIINMVGDYKVGATYETT